MDDTHVVDTGREETLYCGEVRTNFWMKEVGVTPEKAIN